MAPKADKKAASSSDPSYEYKPDEVVLAKIKGFPAWPAHVVDPESEEVPAAVLKDRRGKDTFLVQFFPTGDFAWCAGRDVSLLTPREIDAALANPKKMKKDMVDGYKTARDPSEWKRERADRHAEYMELLAAAEAAKDELESEDAAEDAPKADGKKRKRPSTAAAKDGDKKKKVAKAPKSKGETESAPVSKKAKTTASTDDPAELVKSWRHKLQKVFLGKTDPPAAEMAHCGEYFDAMENFEMKEEWLRESKLNKVLKRIALMKDGSIPEEDKYSFRERSAALASKWTPLMGADSPAPAKPEGTNAAPATSNGAAEDSNAAAEENGAGHASEEADDKAYKPHAESGASEEKPAPMDVEDAAPSTNGDAKATSEETKTGEDQLPSAAEQAPVAAASDSQEPATSA
ncbi:hypothetical protein JCM10908_002634 [Rhodotorula pacifica]|uniref:uncharacterized protein n=1 Tax=Rhodotorula pacifica TaxID=1495444 RepID=UPI003179989E